MGHLPFVGPNVGFKNLICIPNIVSSDEAVRNHISFNNDQEIMSGGFTKYGISMMS